MTNQTIASHELALCEINNGSRYNWRCNAARYNDQMMRSATFAEFARFAAHEYIREFCKKGDQPFTAEDILLCAIELEAYYTQHVAEIDRIAS